MTDGVDHSAVFHDSAPETRVDVVTIAFALMIGCLVVLWGWSRRAAEREAAQGIAPACATCAERAARAHGGSP